MRSLSFLSVLVLILVGFTLCGCRKGSTKFSQSEMQPTDQISTEKDIMLESLYGSNDIIIPPHDSDLDKKIRNAVADIVDTNKIYQIYQYADHNVVHVLDYENRRNTAKVFLNKDLDVLEYLKFIESNPYAIHNDIKQIPGEDGNPAYDLRGKTRTEVENILGAVKWDNDGDPTHAWLWAGGGNFGATNTATLHTLNIVGTQGTMGVKSFLTILNKYGNTIDTIELIGYEIWHPSITDDGRFLAYEYGRAYPEEGGGQETAHFTIYDIENKVHIYEIKDFTKYGNSIFSNGNFICHSKYDPNDKYKRRYYYWYPYERVIYVVPVVNQEGKPWGRFTEKGVLNRNNPNELIKRWTEFKTITFEQYKN